MLRYLAATPDQLPLARSFTAHIAHVAYRIGADGHLLRSQLPPTLRGGLMIVSDGDAPTVSQPALLCEQIIRECLQRNYSGIVLDLESPNADKNFIRQLDSAVLPYHRKLFVPEAWAHCTQYASILLCSALSGGSLQQRLSQAVAQHSPSRLALDGQRLAMDFSLPCPDGCGTPLTVAQLRQRMAGRSVFFSDALCARYFTYRAGEETHFVLFDDADTLRRKTEIAAALGIDTTFFMLPEVSDILPDLFDDEEK